MKSRLIPLAGALALTLLTGAAAGAQERPAYRPLPIPLPEKAVVSIEVDAHQDDLIGVVKSMLKGLNLPALMRMMQGLGGPAGISLPDVTPNGEPAGPGDASGPNFSPNTGLTGAAVVAAPNFADLLKNIHQMHMVVFKAEGFTPDQAIKFYEQPFLEQGGRRALWVNQGENRMLMMAFDKPRGFALVVPTATDITVIRADGYPDLEGVGSFVTMLATMVGSMRSTMSDIFSDTSSTPAEPEVEVEVRPAPRPVPDRVIRRRPAHLVAPKPAAKVPVKKAPVKGRK